MSGLHKFTESERKKIVVVLSSRPDFGGGFQYSQSVWEALKALDRNRWTVTALCLSPAWQTLVERDGYTAILVPDSKIARVARALCKRLPGGARLWRRSARYFSPPMTALHRLNPALAVFPCEPYQSLGTSMPTLTPIHDLMYLYERRFPEVGSPRNFRQRRFVDLNVCRHAKGILVDSNTGKRQVIESYAAPAERVHVLPYAPSPDTGKASVTPVMLPFERFIIYPAQLWAHKNHSALVRALALLKAKGLTVNAVFCGAEKDGGPGLFQEVHELALDDQVSYLGFVDAASLNWLYANAVALVMPTYFGPTNIPPLEAFARGCPVAISDIYGMREQLGDAALYFDPADVGAIAEQVEHLWRDSGLRTSLVHRGAAWLQQWSQEHFNRRFAEIVEKGIAT